MADVDLTARVVRIRSSPTFKTKQGKRRVVALNNTAFLLLQSQAHHSPSDYVFTLNGRKVRDEHAGRLFKRAVRAAKLSDERLHFHSLRHVRELARAKRGEPVPSAEFAGAHQPASDTGLRTSSTDRNARYRGDAVSPKLNMLLGPGSTRRHKRPCNNSSARRIVPEGRGRRKSASVGDFFSQSRSSWGPNFRLCETLQVVFGAYVAAFHLRPLVFRGRIRQRHTITQHFPFFAARSERWLLQSLHEVVRENRGPCLQ